VRAIIAEYERVKITERLVRGRRNRARRGNVVTNNPPYGYRIAVVDDKRMLVVCEPEAKIVRLIFQWYCHGDETSERLSMYRIAKKLSEMNVPTWADTRGLKKKVKKRGHWSPAVVGELLRSETYIGRWYYGRKNDAGLNPREHWITVNVPPIIDHETWKLAQLRAKQNKKESKRNIKHNYLLRYRIRCACGYAAGCQAMKKDNGRGYYLYYRCISSYKAIDNACRTPRFRADQVDPLVWAWVGERLSDPVELRRELENRQAEREADLVPLRQRLAVIDDLLDTNRSQLERLLDLYISGEFRKEMLTERKALLESKIDALDKERRTLAARLQERAFTETDVQSLEDFALEVRQALAAIDDGNFAAKRGLVERLDVTVLMAIEDGEKVIYVSSPVLGRSGGLSVASASMNSSWIPGAMAAYSTRSA